MTLRFSDHPGSRERQLRRRADNPLFNAVAQKVTQEEMGRSTTTAPIKIQGGTSDQNFRSEGIVSLCFKWSCKKVCLFFDGVGFGRSNGFL